MCSEGEDIVSSIRLIVGVDVAGVSGFADGSDSAGD